MSGAEPVQGVREALAEVLRRAYLSGPRSFPHLHAADAVLASAPWQDHAGGVRALREAADEIEKANVVGMGDAVLRPSSAVAWLRVRANRLAERDGDHAGTAVVRVDRYIVTVDGRLVRADERQERQLRAMTDEQRARFITVMGLDGGADS